MDHSAQYELARLTALRKYSILDTKADPAFDRIVRLARHVCGTPIALVSLVDENRQWFKAKVGIDLTETPRSQSLCAIAVQTPTRPLIIEDAHEDLAYVSHPLVVGPPYIRFYAGMPLVDTDGMALGTLCVIDTDRRSLSEEQLFSLRTLADHVMLQIKTAYRLRQLANSEARLLTFMDHTPALCFIKDNRGKYLYVNKAYVEQFKRSPEDVLGKDDFEIWPYNVARQLRAHDLSVLTTKQSISLIRRVVEDDGTVSYWQAEKFLLADDDLLAGVAVNVSALKQNEEQLRATQAELEELSRKDSLTGLKNRRGFWEDFEREWAYAVRYDTPLSLLMMDLDHFKRVNDTFGHDGGDRLLKAVAAILKTDNRTNDLAARFGGAEFVVLLPNTDEDGAKILAERFRQEIEALNVTTISVGVCTRTPLMAEPDKLLKLADVALYRAKRTGRNRVCCASETNDEST